MAKRLILLIALITFSAGYCWAAPAKINIGGSTTLLPIVQKMIEVYMAKYPQVEISIAGSGSGDGLKALMEGSIDIANSSRGLKEKEAQSAGAAGLNLVAQVVAIDCIVPVVNPANPVNELSLEQLKGIYSGQIKNWREVGGQDKTIVVISRDFSSGTFETWQEKVLGKERIRPDAQMQSSNGGVGKSVANNKYAIGYVGLGYVSDKLKGVTVQGVKASASSAKDGSYPLARELYMFTNGPASGVLKQFLDFVISGQGQCIVEAEGFVAAY